jgi:hypothetical protein
MTAECPTPTAEGNPCKGRVPPGRRYCLSHDPERRETIREAGRRGGAARANARRAVKQWAAFGKELPDAELPHVLKSCMALVKAGQMTPAEAQAIAALARTAQAITGEIELEARIAALEEASGVPTPPNVRRFSA